MSSSVLCVSVFLPHPSYLSILFTRVSTCTLSFSSLIIFNSISFLCPISYSQLPSCLFHPSSPSSFLRPYLLPPTFVLRPVVCVFPPSRGLCLSSVLWSAFVLRPVACVCPLSCGLRLTSVPWSVFVLCPVVCVCPLSRLSRGLCLSSVSCGLRLSSVPWSVEGRNASLAASVSFYRL